MLWLERIDNGQTTLAELVEGLDKEELGKFTNEMIDSILALIADCEDADIVFVPVDPEAYDDAAEDASEVYMAWSLGHVIVHTTASAEEGAAIAAELARGVPYRGGRSRNEVPWRSISTLTRLRHRLEESRRMRLASLNMWPDEPDLENAYPGRSGNQINAVMRFILGLRHEYGHLAQIADITDQARLARQQ